MLCLLAGPALASCADQAADLANSRSKLAEVARAKSSVERPKTSAPTCAVIAV